MSRPAINGIAPFFIVRNAVDAIAFYRDSLGFDVLSQGPGDDPFFGMIGRGGAMLMVKAVAANPEPNATRDPEARWDAYIHVPDPGALAAEFTARGSSFPHHSRIPTTAYTDSN